MAISKEEVVRSRTVCWLLAAGATLALFRVIPYQSTFIEHIYSRGLYKVYRSLWDHTIAFSPIPLIYLVILIALAYLFYPLVRGNQGSTPLRLVKRAVQLACFAIVVFYWCWGFNYKRASLNETLELGADEPVENWLVDTYCHVTDSLASIKQRLLVYDTIHIYGSEHQLRKDLETAFEKIGLPTTGRVRARLLSPKGSLLHLSTAGVYLPWAGEGHLDKGLHPIVHPFTMMHEMSHGYGWTGEDECNFLALMCAINSSDDRIRYSGYFGFWRYLRYQLYVVDRVQFDQLFRNVDELVMADYDEILAYSRRYKEILPELRDIFYDNYLKSHGISSGLINYNQMIKLAYKWELKHGSLRLD